MYTTTEITVCPFSNKHSAALMSPNIMTNEFKSQALECLMATRVGAPCQGLMQINGQQKCCVSGTVCVPFSAFCKERSKWDLGFVYTLCSKMSLYAIIGAVDTLSSSTATDSSNNTVEVSKNTAFSTAISEPNQPPFCET
ncbi:hypothetical protein TNCV_3168891 [Trichonephila clavipes]|nr:hypothetical protein TNCV_3168891 [Trichonephila clavipes]